MGNLKIMKIIKADSSYKNIVLDLLEDHRDACVFVSDLNYSASSSLISEFSSEMFDRIIFSKDSAIFLALDGEEGVALAIVHKIPQIREGIYVAEIEEMFVLEKYRGQGISKKIILSIVDWAIDQGVSDIRLESSNSFEQRRDFYVKMGFREYGKNYIKKLV